MFGGTADEPGLDLVVDAYTQAANGRVIVTAAIYADVERVGDVFTGEAGGIQPVKVYISMLADYDEQATTLSSIPRRRKKLRITFPSAARPALARSRPRARLAELK
ncbi:MAG: hypothetical protein WB696_02140 [Chthoniobacterales bacterium]